MVIGQVTVNDEPTKAKLLRFCEKKIDQWIKSHFDQNSTPQADAEFKVSFQEEGKQISCVTEISMKGALWRGCDLGGDTQNAFMHSLKRLQPH